MRLLLCSYQFVMNVCMRIDGTKHGQREDLLSNDSLTRKCKGPCPEMLDLGGRGNLEKINSLAVERLEMMINTNR